MGSAILKIGDTIRLDGEGWIVSAFGATFDGKTYVAMKSPTRGRQHKNGWCPVQIADWLVLSEVDVADEGDCSGRNDALDD